MHGGVDPNEGLATMCLGSLILSYTLNCGRGEVFFMHPKS